MDDELRKADKFHKEAQEKVNKETGQEIPTRRVRMCIFEAHEFMFLFTKGMVFNKKTAVIEGLPKDATLVGVSNDPVRGGIVFVIESEEYEPIPINILPPFQQVSFQTAWKPNGQPKSTK